MATLSGNKIKDTYQSLVKFSDNGNITTSAKQLTDGFGNNSPMFVSTTQVGIGVTPESGLNLHVFGDAKIGSNLTVIGNLVVEGSTTTVGTDTLTVKDPLIVLANNNTSTDAVDIGFYGKYTPSGTTLYSGLFREALTGKYRLFKGLEVEPTTTVNTSGTGYAVATLIANLEGNVTGNLIGSVTGGAFSGTLLSNVVATTQSAGDNSTKVATTAYVDNQVGLYDTLSEVLANGNTTGGTDIAVSAGDDITFTDTSKSIYGTDGELEIHHNGTNSYITEDGTGALYLQGTYMYLTKSDGSQNYIELDLDGATDSRVKLNYGGATKLQTTNTGVNVTGDVDFTGNINIGDNQKILFGDSGDVEMFFNGSSFVIDDTVEVFGFDIDTNLIRFRGTDLYTEISNAQHTFWTNGTERFKINTTEVKVSHQLNVTGDLIVDTDTLFVDVSEDSVGIGLTNPADYTADELVINVPDDSGMTLVSAATDTAYITFADGTTAADQANFISHDHNTNTLTIFSQAKVSIGILEAEVAYFTDTAFYVDKSTTIDDNLNVISGASYGSGLQVSRTGHPSLSIITGGTSNAYIGIAPSGGTYVDAITISDTGNSTFAGNVTLSQPTNGSDAILNLTSKSAAGNSRTSSIEYDADNEYMYFKNAGTTVATMTSGGNVGIGVSTVNNPFTAQAALQVGDTSTTTNNGLITIGSGTAGSGDIYFADGTSGGSQYRGFVSYKHNGDYLAFGTAETTRMIIDSSGNVGIGTTSPATKLHLKESTTNSVVQIAFENDSRQWRFGINGNYADDSINLYDLQANTTPFIVKGGTGNVGIGTDSPATKLHVVGTIKLGGYSYIGEDLSDQDSLTIASDHTEAIHFAHFTPATGTYSTNMIIDSSGNVGIGSTSPEAKLDISNVAGATYALEISTPERNRALFFYNSASVSDAGYLGIKRGSVDALNHRFATTGNSAVCIGEGNFGIGTDSPQQLLHISNTSGDFGAEAVLRGSTSTGTPKSEIAFKRGSSGDGAEMVLRTSNSSGTIQDVMTLDTSGNVGIGVTPANWNTITPIQVKNSAFAGLSSGNTHVAYMSSNFFYQSGDKYIANGQATVYTQANGKHSFYSAPENTSGAGAALTFTERMRITSEGYILLGTEGLPNGTSVYGSAFIPSSVDRTVLSQASSSTAASVLQVYRNPNGIVGSISMTNSTTSYNTSSDYRLKENVVKMTGALDRVNQLKPSRFNFIADADTTVDGFLAHEVQEIVPEAITGEKDAMRTEEYEVTPDVYEDVVHPAEEAVYETIEHPAVEEELDDEGNVIVEGKEAYTEEVLVTEAKEEWTEKVLVSEKVMGTREVPDYQGIDQSKLVPLLVGAIQELKAEIESLKLQINN